MENGNFIRELASLFGQNASVRNVYGEPVQAGDKTIIPVARIAYGLGGGYGHGNNKKRLPYYDTAKRPEGADAEGAGGGGGLYAKPADVYEVTSTRTRFIPANNARQLLIGIALGFIIRACFTSRCKSESLAQAK